MKRWTDIVRGRREAVLSRLSGRRGILLASGALRPRNYPKNTFPFRTSSHVLFFAGKLPAGSYLYFDDDQAVGFLEEGRPDDYLWHGPQPSWSEIARSTALDKIISRDKFHGFVERVGRHTIVTIPPVDLESWEELTSILGRPLSLLGPDRQFAQAVVAERLMHDDLALEEIRSAVATTARAFRRGMLESSPGRSEQELVALMEFECRAMGCALAYESIVTTDAQILHNSSYRNVLRNGDLVLADLGAESEFGYASDVTRTWPVSGRFSPSQRAVYDVVLAAQRQAIEAIAPRRGFRDIHLEASLVIAAGLVELGLLRGDPASLVERGAHALFFPHGLGHLLGLDVHDMEDLGDTAGYAPGRRRSAQFGLSALRLDRILQPGMVLTVEPGIYFVPEILHNRKLTDEFRDCLVLDGVERFHDVKGIRIEDTVHVTQSGADVLSSAIPKTVEEVEAATSR